jgi:hypothetical protein
MMRTVPEKRISESCTGKGGAPCVSFTARTASARGAAQLTSTSSITSSAPVWCTRAPEHCGGTSPSANVSKAIE